MKSRKKMRRNLFKKKRNKTKWLARGVMIRLWSHTMKSKRKKKQFHNKNLLKMMNQASLNNQLSLLRRNKKMSRIRMSHLRKMVLISKSNKIWKRRNLKKKKKPNQLKNLLMKFLNKALTRHPERMNQCKSN